MPTRRFQAARMPTTALRTIPLRTVIGSLLSIVTILLLTSATAHAAPPRVVRVYVLAGQSNMEGQGFIDADPQRNGGQGTLEFLVKQPATAPKFAHLVDEAGKWRTRDDVWISYLERRGPLTVGYGARPDRIGPELGLGWVVGDAYEEPVLLVKCAWGGKSLAIDFRPPSAGKPPYSLGEKGDAALAENPEQLGKYYRETVRLVKTALAQVDELVPGGPGQVQLAGFGWHQGWNDRISDQFNAEYAENLSHFIRDIRRDLEAPGLPFVIAETGMTGETEKHPRALSLMKAQASVAERDEFRGNVAFVGTKAFWRDASVSPSGQGYHWNTNAETYYLIGEAMGRAMVRLVEPRAKNSE
jgi:alpha-galactosidase